MLYDYSKEASTISSKQGPSEERAHSVTNSAAIKEIGSFVSSYRPPMIA